MMADHDAFGNLVEAATALARLSSFASTVSASPTEKQGVVSSDDEDVDIRERYAPAEASPAGDASDPACSMRNKREIFPQRLMAILNDPTLSESITWLPHGRSFVILRPDVFMEQILPKYLPPIDARGSTKYASFTRKLNRWGFRQATRGPDTGAFNHPLFRRDKPDLCLDMVCQRSRERTKPSSPSKTERSVGSLPPKKRIPVESRASQLIPLTKESLAAMSTIPESPSNSTVAAAVSVTDDSRSVASNSNSDHSGSQTLAVAAIPRGITNDKAFVDSTLRKHDEMEQLRVAKAMLYENFMQAMRAVG